MADDFALAYRKNRSERRTEPSAGLSLPRLVLLAFGAALSAAAVLTMAPPTWRSLAALIMPAPAPAPAPATVFGPRVISVVSGVRDMDTSGSFGLTLGRTRPLAQVYLPVGPVMLRFEDRFVEVDGGRLYPPPIGGQRINSRVLDHATVLANMLRQLSFTPCDLHLRYVAAANINLFVGGFAAPRTAIRTDAAPDTAFWQRVEASVVRRVVQDLSERGALGLADFGLDTSPEIKGLFQGVRQVQPACG